MADSNSLTLDARSWIDAREWAAAPDAVRRRYLERVCVLVKAAKQRQALRGRGGDGEAMAPRKRPRPDGADGKVLSPHRTASRSVKWVRAVPAHGSGKVTLYWSHGWGRILGFHANGEVPGAPVRDLIQFPPSVVSRLKGDARREWRTLYGEKPKANPRVVYLHPGQKPKAFSRKIQVT